VAALLGYFIGDDPQRVHTFRPLPAATLWVEYHLWGYRRAPYLVVNCAWFVATALALVWLCRILGMPRLPAVACGLLFMLLPTRGSKGALSLLATRHDLTCVLFAVLAFGMLIRYFEEGRRRDLWLYALLSMLAYLSKEMALALVPTTFAVALIVHKSTTRERIVHAGVAALAVAALWFAWYRLAEMNMAPPRDASHHFGGLLMLSRKRWHSILVLFAGNLHRSLAAMWILVEAVEPAALPTYPFFWSGLARVSLFLLTVVLLAMERPRWLLLLYAWKICTYLPVAPMVEQFPWHCYMPHVLDPILPVGAVWVALHRYGFYDRAALWWRRKHRANRSAEEGALVDDHDHPGA